MYASFVAQSLLLVVPLAAPAESLSSAPARAFRRQVAPLQDSGACECLNWRQVYAANQTKCGRGFEFAPVASEFYAGTNASDYLNGVDKTVMPMKFMFNREFCKSFYEVLDDNQCVRTSMDRAPGKWYGQSWCYVSDFCSLAEPDALFNVTVANSRGGVRVKMCQKGKDTLMSDMSPEELMAYGSKMGLEFAGFLAKVAYPFERHWFYDDAQAHQAELQDIVHSGEPVTIGRVDEHHDKVIIMGEKAWLIPHGGINDSSGRNGYEGFKCVKGC